MSDVVRTIFEIADIQRRLDINSDIFVEDSEEKKYFTLSNIDDIPEKILKLTLKKNGFRGKYKIANGKITFEQDIIYSDLEELLVQEPVALVEDITLHSSVSPEKVSEINLTQSQELITFDYMDEEDLYDLEEYAGKLNSIMLIVGGGGVSEAEVTEIYTYLDKISSILATYSEVYPISKALSELSTDMASHIQEFIDNSEALGPMCKAFSNDMSGWIDQSFHTGAPSADFMNDTIVVNSQTIAGMLKMDAMAADGDESFDDIFDF